MKAGMIAVGVGDKGQTRARRAGRARARPPGAGPHADNRQPPWRILALPCGRTGNSGRSQAETKNPKPISQQEKREKLSASKRSGQRRVRFAEELADHAKNCIADKEHAGKDPIRQPKVRPQNPKDRKEQDAFESSLIKLRRMARRERAGE